MLRAEDTGVDYHWDFFDNVLKAATEMGDSVIKKVGVTVSKLILIYFFIT